MIKTDINDAITAAAQQGDSKRLKSLSEQFPLEFSAACTKGLLEKAHQAARADIVLELILRHGCLVDTATLPMQDKELFGERRAQLHRTLEVFADAARGNTYNDMHEEVRGAGCYDVTNLAARAAEKKMQPNGLSPILLASAANGDLKNFISWMRQEEVNGNFILGRHSGAMLGSLENNIAAVAAYSPNAAGPVKEPTPSETLPPR